MRLSCSRLLRSESLEPRELLTVTAADDVFSVPQDRQLVVSDLVGGDFLGISAANDFSAVGNAEQIEYSPKHDLVFTRNSGSSVRVFDALTGEVLSTHLANASFTDFDLSPSEDFLFVADFGGENVGHSEPSNPHYVHRYDLANRTWATKDAPHIAWRIEGISDSRFVVQEQDQWIEVMLNDFGEGDAEITEIARTFAGYSGDIEYDHANSRLVHASGLTSRVNIFTVTNTAITSDGQVETPGGNGRLTLSTDGTRLYFGSLEVEASDPSDTKHLHSSPIRAASGELAFGTDGKYYEPGTGEELGSLGFASNAVFVSADSKHVWTFNPDTDRLHHFLLSRTGLGVLANDRSDPGFELEAQLLDLPTNGDVDLNVDGTFSYTPAAGFVGTDSFTYQAMTIDGDVAEAKVTIEVRSGEVVNQPPSGPDKEFYIDQDSPLVLNAESGDISSGLDQVSAFSARGNVIQIEYSPTTDLVAVRNSGSAIRIIDATTLAVVSTQLANAQFSDMDLTAEGRYLFVADYGPERDRNDPPDYVHRFDMEDRSWSVKLAPKTARKIEAVSANRVLLEEQHVAVTLNSFPEGDEAMAEVSRHGSGISGDLEYDDATGFVFHTNQGLPFWGIGVLRVAEDALSSVGEFNSPDFENRHVTDSAVLATDGSRLYDGPRQLEALDTTNLTNTLPEVIYAASGEIAIGEHAVYEAETARRLGATPFPSKTQHISEGGEHFWSFNGDSDELYHYRLRERQQGLLAYDYDDGDDLTVELVSSPTNGTLEALQSNGVTRYVPSAGFTGTDSFQYRLFDGEFRSDPITVTINVINTGGIETTPVAVPDSYSVAEDGMLSVTVSEPSNLSLSEVGSFEGSADQLEYSARFGVIITRQESTVRLIDALTLDEISSITATNRFSDMDLTGDERYLFVADYAGEVIGRGTPLGPHYVHRFDLASKRWVTRQAPQIAWKIEAVAEDRVLLQERDQHVDMTLNSFPDEPNAVMTELSRTRADYSGDFEYDDSTGRVYHGSSGSSSSEIHVRRVVNDTLQNAGDTGVYGTADCCGGTSVLSSDGARFYYGRLQVEALDVRNNLRQFPEEIIAASADIAFGREAYYNAATGDRLGALSLEAGVATSDQRHFWAVSDGRIVHYVIGGRTGGVLGNDSDLAGSELSAQLVTPPANGAITFRPDGSFDYTPNEGFFGGDTFQYVAKSGNLQSEAAEVTIEVTPMNRPPTLGAIADVTIDEDSDIVIPLEVDDPTTRLSRLQYVATTTDSRLLRVLVIGLVTDRELRITPRPDQSGSADVTLTVRDGEFEVSQTFNVEVRPVNDPPEARRDSYRGEQNETLTVAAERGLLRNDGDIDDELGVPTIVSPPEGTLELRDDGSFDYTPPPGFSGRTEFTYQLTDPGGASSTATVQITVDDSVPPTVTNNSLEGATLFGGRLTAVLQLSEAVDSRLNPQSLWLSRAGSPLIFPSSSEYLAESRQIRVTFPAVETGEYTLHLTESSVTDIAGNRLDGDGNGRAGGAYRYEFIVTQPIHELTASTSVESVSADDIVEVSLDYRSLGLTGHSGVAVRVHYDSSVLSWEETVRRHRPSNLVRGYDTADEDNMDGDSTTDRYVLLAWSDSSSSWPGLSDSLDLATLLFNANGVLQVPGETHIRITQASSATGFEFRTNQIDLDVVPNFSTLDVDLDNDVNGDDAVLINRYMLGVRGNELTRNSVSGSANRLNPEAIGQYLDSIFHRLDVDGSGQVDAFVDGLLIDRYIAGMSDEAMIAGVLGSNAERTTAAAIRSYLDNYNAPALSEPAPMPRPGDANGDDQVNVTDFLILSRSFGDTCEAGCDADFNQDGSVDLHDFLTLSRNFGRRPGGGLFQVPD